MSLRSEDFTSDDVGLSDGFTTMGAGGVGLTEGQFCTKCSKRYLLVKFTFIIRTSA